MLSYWQTQQTSDNVLMLRFAIVDNTTDWLAHLLPEPYWIICLWRIKNCGLPTASSTVISLYSITIIKYFKGGRLANSIGNHVTFEGLLFMSFWIKRGTG